VDGLCLRDATHDDAEAIAGLHAESWRRTYRGIYSDSYLDGEVVAERRAAWRERFANPDPAASTVAAELQGALVGFAHTILDADATWGTLLDNLHVAPDVKRSGIGTVLLGASAAFAAERGTTPVLHLWVLEANLGARAFYDARGGECVERAGDHAPDGTRVIGLRYVWRDANVLRARR